MEGYCINIFLVQLLVSVPSILCDIAILCLPLPHVLRLKTNLTQKVFLVFMFMLGSYVVFTSIYRFTVYLAYSHQDVPFTLAIPVAWNVIEISSGIVSSCLPTLVSSILISAIHINYSANAVLQKGPIIRPVIKSVMPSSLGMSGHQNSGHMGYERKNGAGSRSGLVTIGGGGGGGGARKSNGHWSKLDSSARRAHTDGTEYDVDEDIELQPRGKMTTIVIAQQGVPGYSHESSTPVGSTPQRPGAVNVIGRESNDSDESLFAAHGITCTRTVEVQWSTEPVSVPSPVARVGTSRNEF